MSKTITPLFLILFFAVHFVDDVGAQNTPLKTYTIKDYDNNIKDALLFDQRFNIQIEYSKGNIPFEKGFLRQLRTKKQAKRILEGNNQVIDKIENRICSFTSFIVKNLNPKADKKHVWQLQIDPLPANKEFQFWIPIKLNDIRLSKFHDFNLKLHVELHAGRNIFTSPSLQSEYKELVDTFDDLCDTSVPSNYLQYDYSAYLNNVFIPLIDRHFQTLSNAIHISGAMYTDQIQFIQNIDGSSMLNLTAELGNLLTSLHAKTETEIYHIISKISQIGTDAAGLIFGLSKLSNGYNINYSSLFHSKNRLNRKAHLVNIEKLENVIRDDRITLSGVHKASLLGHLSSLKSKITAIEKCYNDISKDLNRHGKHICSYKMIYGSTMPATFKDYIGNYLRADIGLMTFRGVEDIGFGELGNNIKGYAGLMYFPFATSNDIPESMQPVEKRLFIHLGLMFGSIADNRIRKDFFKDNNLFFGGGYQIKRSIHFSAGGLLYKVNNANPLSNDTKVVIGPYISFGFNPNLNSLLNPLIGRIPK